MTALNIITSCLCIVAIAVIFIFTKWIHKLLSDVEPTEVKVKLFKGGKLPEFKTESAACADCRARLDEDVVIPSGKRALIPLGIACGLPEGYEIQVRPRSGLSSKSIDVTLGTGDADYTGEYKANVVNTSGEDFVVHNGDRICQMAFREVPKVSFAIVSELEKTERGDGGFGHTGIN